MTNEQMEWVRRVLGVKIGDAGAAESAEAVGRALLEWRAVSDLVDNQIARLQATLRGSDDEELAAIAEFGLNGVTGNHKVPLLAALMGASAGNAGDRAKLPGIVLAFRNYLENDEAVEACDENPFGVTVSIRQSLVAALKQVELAIAS